MKVCVMKRLFLVLIMASLLAAGCESEVAETGVVATVNGRPIYLSQLESEYDFQHSEAAQGLNPTVERLREDYSGLVLNLIV